MSGVRKAPGLCLGLCLGMLAAAGGAHAADWPQFRADAARTACTAEELTGALALRWTYRATHPPQPAWPGDGRLAFDGAFGLVAAGDAVYFGSSADGKVYCLEAATGRERWTFFTGAPVRFAPAVWKDRVLAASDDGHLYCLAAGDGRLLWSNRGGPDDGMILGNGRMISRWPARGGPAVVDDVVYFAAGIWPAEGVYIHALSLPDGKSLWTNDTTGAMSRGHPHEAARLIASGIGAQGYLAAADGLLLVPTGRGLPVALGRADGKFRYFQVLQKVGGVATVVAGSRFLNDGGLFSLADGKTLSDEFPLVPSALAVGPDFIAGALRGKKELCLVDRAEPLTKAGPNIKARVPMPAPTAVIAAGKRLFVGAQGRVSAVDALSREVRPIATVEGTVLDLAAAGGRLLASTDRGEILCFDGRPGGTPAVVEGRAAAGPGPAGIRAEYAAAAEEIVRKTGVTEGYCLDLGCGGGELALELARRTKLHICAVESDPELVAAARRRLDAAGLYGGRVTVHHGDPAQAPFPRYFANLVVSGRSTVEGEKSLPAGPAGRCLRPFGGALCVGRPGAMRVSVRAPLEGAGRWTHLYADAGNTGASEDVLVRSPLRVLWFGGPDLDVPNRHGRPPAPLFADGRMFVQGVDAIRAVDAYNGRLVWELPLKGVGKPYDNETLMGVSGDAGNFCLAPEGLFVRVDGRCLRIDAATGRELGAFELPERSGRWGYLACEGGRLYGTVADDRHLVRSVYRTVPAMLRTESLSLFALDAKTGKLLWTYKARDSIRHNAIAVGGGRVFLIDRRPASFDLAMSSEKKGKQPGGRLVALDADSGREVWSSSENIYGTMLALSAKHDALLMGYQQARYSLGSEVGGRLAAFGASTGRRLWDEAVSGSRPIVVDRAVHGSPDRNAPSGARDLLTGRPLGEPGARRSGLAARGHYCGLVTASRWLLLFRSGPLGYVDLASGELRHYGGVRPGCWINALPVGGLVLLPDFTNDCSCSYQNKTTLALESAGAADPQQQEKPR